eukprot:11184307-Lingulodinium_polyedra.AAC.1
MTACRRYAAQSAATTTPQRTVSTTTRLSTTSVTSAWTSIGRPSTTPRRRAQSGRRSHPNQRSTRQTQ